MVAHFPLEFKELWIHLKWNIHWHYLEKLTATFLNKPQQNPLVTQHHHRGKFGSAMSCSLFVMHICATNPLAAHILAFLINKSPWKTQQCIAVVGVLLLTQCNFAWQALGEGMGQGVEFIQNSDNAGLFGE